MLWWTLRQLRSSDARTALGAAEKLGDSRNPRAAKPLVEKLRHGWPAIQLAAAEALGKIGDARATEPLIEALKDSGLQRSAAEALGEIRDRRAIKPLLPLLREKGLGVSRAAGEALIKIGVPEDLLAKDLQDLEADVRALVAELLGKTKNAQATPFLVPALRDSHPWVRREAAKSLDSLGWKPRDERDRAIKAIAEEKWEEATHLGEVAVELLATDLAAWRDAYWLATKDRVAIAAVLGRSGAGQAVQALRAVAEDEDPAVRSEAVSSLQRLGCDPADDRQRAWLAVAQADWDGAVRFGEAAVDALIGSLKSKDAAAQRAAAAALGQIGSRLAVPPLVQVLVNQEDVDVRREAENALQQIDPAWSHLETTRALVPLLRKRLLDGSVIVRVEAARILGRVGDKSASGDLAQLLRSGDLRIERETAARALAQMGEDEVLRALLTYDVREVRDDAAAALHEAVQRSPASVPHASNFAGSVLCQHCHKRHAVKEWPVRGDFVPFYFQKERGKYSQHVFCPHCGRDWYVVWDQSPGEIMPLEIMALE